MELKSISKRTSVAFDTQVSSRSDIFTEEMIDEQEIKEEAQRMDSLMKKLLGGQMDEEEQEEEDSNMMQEKDSDEQPEEEFAFRLFSSQPVAKVTIADTIDNTDSLSKAISEQQQYEFDETEPEFVARINEVVVDYKTIIEQSTVPYPTAVYPRRLIHLPTPEEQAEKEAAEKKKSIKKRKSKKCRDFEKAVKEGKIKIEANMRNPSTPGGWPGWPGNTTKVAIINYISPKKGNGQFGRGTGGGFNKMARGGAFRGSRGRGFSGSNRGTRGGQGGRKPF